jgi:predicted DNA-binding transcriptional regulator YafY
MVEATADVDLARQARSVVSKAESILPAHLRDRLRAVSIHAPSFHLPEDLARNMEPLRRAIADGRKVRFDYATARGEASERVARPLGLYFWGRAWTSACWCELRQDFRSFRLDRMERLTVLPDPIPVEAGRDLATFLQRARAEPEIDES